MELRRYRSADCEELSALFYQTVHAVNAKDYSPQQLDAWASGSVDLPAWNQSFLEHATFVAEENGQIAGFGDIDRTGYLDRLFVHQDYQRQGIATALCDALEASVSAITITTHASITARPFFERRGYRLIKEQQVERNGVMLINFLMQKQKGAFVTMVQDDVFWDALDALVSSSELVIDRPKGSAHPHFVHTIYPVDYGYLKDTRSMDQGGIDVWLGTDNARRLDAVICTVDRVKRDSEIKLLIGCTQEEKARIYAFHNQSPDMKGLLIAR